MIRLPLAADRVLATERYLSDLPPGSYNATDIARLVKLPRRTVALGMTARFGTPSRRVWTS